MSAATSGGKFLHIASLLRATRSPAHSRASGNPEPPARDSGSAFGDERMLHGPYAPGCALIAGYSFRQPIEHPRQIGLDRARVDVEHAIAPLDQPHPPLGTGLGCGRAF